MLALAVVALLVVLARTGGLPAYAAAGTWAMLGIAVTASGDGTTSVLVAAVVGAVLLVGVAGLLATRRPR